MKDQEKSCKTCKHGEDFIDSFGCGLRYLAPQIQSCIPGLIHWEPKEKSQVEHPSHSTAYPVEVIDIIRSSLGEEGFKAYCFGNEIKYRMRAGLKNDAQQDIEKAMMYKKFREQK